MSGNRIRLVGGNAPPLSRTSGEAALADNATATWQPVGLVSAGLQIEETFVLEKPGSSDPSPTRRWMGMSNGLITVTMLFIALAAKGEWRLPAFQQRQTNSNPGVLVASLTRAPSEALARRPAAIPGIDIAPSQPEGRHPSSPPPQPVPAPRTFDRETIGVMVKRGRELIASGNLAAARLVLQHAAEAGDADAAQALATTYDPVILRKLNVYGLAPDPVKARNWYQQAKKFRSPAAPN